MRSVQRMGICERMTSNMYLSESQQTFVDPMSVMFPFRYRRVRDWRLRVWSTLPLREQ